MVLNRQNLTEIITEELKKSDIVNFVRNDKDFEKRVKEIAADVVTELFRVLWQHNGIFRTLSR
jgi:hypothetical protein